MLWSFTNSGRTVLLDLEFHLVAFLMFFVFGVCLFHCLFSFSSFKAFFFLDCCLWCQGEEPDSGESLFADPPSGTKSEGVNGFFELAQGQPLRTNRLLRTLLPRYVALAFCVADSQMLPLRGGKKASTGIRLLSPAPTTHQKRKSQGVPPGWSVRLSGCLLG